MKTLEKTCDFAPATSQRLDRVVQQLTGLSRAGVRGLLDQLCVSVNGSPSKIPNLTVSTGDIVRVRYNPHQRYKQSVKQKSDPAYRILFEDEHLLVVDKAAHVLTVPSASGRGKTLIEALERSINRASGGRPSKLHGRLHIVHRLDHGVSGVLVLAKTAQAAANVKKQFAAHKPKRIYIAIVNGTLKPGTGTYRSHLATDRALNRYSTRRPGKGELAITHYEVVGCSPERGAMRDSTIVRVQLETGRRNQIRVHFAEAGHPILGDRRYPRTFGNDDDRAASAHPRWRVRRLALHAASLELNHPVTGKAMRFEADLPPEFQPFLQRQPTQEFRLLNANLCPPADD